MKQIGGSCLSRGYSRLPLLTRRDGCVTDERCSDRVCYVLWLVGGRGRTVIKTRLGEQPALLVVKAFAGDAVKESCR